MYIPYGIEVNSHDCTINCQLFEFMNPSQSGYSVAPLIQTMIDRSQAFLIAGKKILLLNLGVSSKRFILDSAIQHRIKVAIEFCYWFFFNLFCVVFFYLGLSSFKLFCLTVLVYGPFQEAVTLHDILSFFSFGPIPTP